MLENTLYPTELFREPLEVLNRRFITFSLSKSEDHTTVNIVGCI